MSRYKNFINVFENAVNNSGRNITDIELIAVSKTKSENEIKSVISEGHSSFGENKLQEIENKWVSLKALFPNLRLHFIGAIQSRKVAAIHKYCDVIHSLDRMKLIKKFDEIETASNIKRDYFIQINTGNESQKSGVYISDAEAFIGQCIENHKINLLGLMCIPPVNENPKKHFNELRALSENFNLKYLSMGMSGDYQEAINSGSTHIRVGTNIFGERS